MGNIWLFWWGRYTDRRACWWFNLCFTTSLPNDVLNPWDVWSKSTSCNQSGWSSIPEDVTKCWYPCHFDFPKLSQTIQSMLMGFSSAPARDELGVWDEIWWRPSYLSARAKTICVSMVELTHLSKTSLIRVFKARASGSSSKVEMVSASSFPSNVSYLPFRRINNFLLCHNILLTRFLCIDPSPTLIDEYEVVHVCSEVGHVRPNMIMLLTDNCFLVHVTPWYEWKMVSWVSYQLACNLDQAVLPLSFEWSWFRLMVHLLIQRLGQWSSASQLDSCLRIKYSAWSKSKNNRTDFYANEMPSFDVWNATPSSRWPNQRNIIHPFNLLRSNDKRSVQISVSSVNYNRQYDCTRPQTWVNLYRKHATTWKTNDDELTTSYSLCQGQAFVISTRKTKHKPKHIIAQDRRCWWYSSCTVRIVQTNIEWGLTR